MKKAVLENMVQVAGLTEGVLIGLLDHGGYII